MYDKRTLYELLGLPKSGLDTNGNEISDFYIERAYKSAKRANISKEELEKVDEAYKILSDRFKRNEYNRRLKDNTLEGYTQTKPVVTTTSNDLNYEYAIPVKKQERHVPVEQTLEQKQESIKLRRFLVRHSVGAAAGLTVGFAIGGVVGGIAGLIIGVACENAIKNRQGKICLQKEPKEKKISEIKTKEAALIEEQNKQIEKEILDLLSVPNNNYKLAIAIKKYENQIQLINGKIKLRLSEIEKPGIHWLTKLNIKCLERSKNKAEENLKLLKSKVLQKQKEGKMQKLNKEIIEKNTKLKTELKPKEGEEETLKQKKERSKTQKKLNNLVIRRDGIANNWVLSRNGIARRQIIMAKFTKYKDNLIEYVEDVKSRTR